MLLSQKLLGYSKSTEFVSARSINNGAPIMAAPVNLLILFIIIAYVRSNIGYNFKLPNHLTDFSAYANFFLGNQDDSGTSCGYKFHSSTSISNVMMMVLCFRFFDKKGKKNERNTQCYKYVSIDMVI